MPNKVPPAESTPPQSQREHEGSVHSHCLETIAVVRDTNRRKGGIISDEHSDTTVSIRSVVSMANEPRYSKVTAKSQPCLRHVSNGAEVFLYLWRIRSDLSLLTGWSIENVLLRELFVVDKLESNKLTSLDGRGFGAEISFNKEHESICNTGSTRKCTLRPPEHYNKGTPSLAISAIKYKHNGLGRFPNSGAIHHHLVVKTSYLRNLFGATIHRKISSGDQLEGTPRTRSRLVTLNDGMKALKPLSARRELQRNTLTAVRFWKERTM
ncbi:hypothetical protein EVAR_42429_1 [Eumeta japonica]|uniref:Uncharacterized protein n=1 Tax=Eumeta variegata TaxID=151549 RepID=A0A4C1XAV6_EUMVA|nr:hypothetical protein EVAR_42429_1 [Eumeta japonica]